MKRRILSLLMALSLMLTLAPAVLADESSTSASIFSAGNIRYRILDETEKTVEVIHSSGDQPVVNLPDSTYSGDVTIPATVTNDGTEYTVVGIDALAFICAKLTSISLPEGLQYIDGGAFASSTLASIEIPASVTRLGGGDNSTPVFSNDRDEGCQIESITFASGSQLTEIAESAFGQCGKLTTLEIPAGVTDLGLDHIAENGTRNLGALNGWVNAKNVTFAEGSPYYKDENGVLYKGDTLCVALDDEITSVTVKDGTKTIADCAFYVCTNLATINLPEGLETIGDGAFNYAPNLNAPTIPLPGFTVPGSTPANVVAQINIPSTVTSIGEDFLKGGLKEDGSSVVIMQGTTPPEIGEGAFATEAGKTASLHIYYPESAKDAYTATDYPLSGYIAAEEDDDHAELAYGLSLQDTSLTIGSTTTFSSTVPETATIEWSSNNPAVATVSNGLVTAVKEGTATITASIKLDDIVLVSAACNVTVKTADVPFVPVPPVTPTQPTKPAEPDQPEEPDTPVIPGALPFVDVSAGDWYYEDVAYVYAQGIMTGSTATSFAPNDAMTRAMVWTVLGRMSGEDVEGGTPWYALAQAWAVSDGVSDGTGPNDSITREQLVTMLYRQAGSPEVGVSELALLGRFTDGEAVSDWAEEAMAWAVSQGILTGDGDLLKPQATATRAQVAAILARFCANMEQ